MSRKRALKRRFWCAWFRETGELYGGTNYDERAEANIRQDYRKHGIPMGPRLDRAPSVLDATEMAQLFDNLKTDKGRSNE